MSLLQISNHKKIIGMPGDLLSPICRRLANLRSNLPEPLFDHFDAMVGLALGSIVVQDSS